MISKTLKNGYSIPVYPMKVIFEETIEYFHVSFFSEMQMICQVLQDLKSMNTAIRKYLNPLSANPTNGQTHSDNSSATADELFECV